MQRAPGGGAEQVRIDREVWLGQPGAFADIRHVGRGTRHTLSEVKYGYPEEAILRHLRRSMGTRNAPVGERVIVVADTARRKDWDGILAALRAELRLPLEVWSAAELFARIQSAFGVTIQSLSPETLIEPARRDRSRQGFPRLWRQESGRLRQRPVAVFTDLALRLLAPQAASRAAAHGLGT